MFRFVAAALTALGIYVSSFAAHAINERLAFSRATDGRIIITVTGGSYNICGEVPPLYAQIFPVERLLFLLPFILPPPPFPYEGAIAYRFPPVVRGPNCGVGATLRGYSYTLLLPVFPEGAYATTLSSLNGEIFATANLDTRALAIPPIPTHSAAGIAALLMSIVGAAYFGLRRKWVSEAKPRRAGARLLEKSIIVILRFNFHEEFNESSEIEPTYSGGICELCAPNVLIAFT